MGRVDASRSPHGCSSAFAIGTSSSSRCQKHTRRAKTSGTRSTTRIRSRAPGPQAWRGRNSSRFTVHSTTPSAGRRHTATRDTAPRLRAARDGHQRHGPPVPGPAPGASLPTATWPFTTARCGPTDVAPRRLPASRAEVGCDLEAAHGFTMERFSTRQVGLPTFRQTSPPQRGARRTTTPPSWYRESWPELGAFALPTFSDARVRINRKDASITALSLWTTTAGSARKWRHGSWRPATLGPAALRSRTCARLQLMIHSTLKAPTRISSSGGRRGGRCGSSRHRDDRAVPLPPHRRSHPSRFRVALGAGYPTR
jgi:hypothetical protein